MVLGKLKYPVLLVIAAALIFLGYNLATRESFSHSRYIDFTRTELTEHWSQTQTRDARPLRIAIAAVLSPKDSINHYWILADYLSRQIDAPVVLIQRQSYNEVGMLLAKGGADIAFYSSGAYAAITAQGDIELLVMQERKGIPYYEGYVLVPADSTARTLQDLRGKSFAFSDPLSYSGYIFLVHQLQQDHQTPEAFFGSYFFTYSHEKSLRAVANRIVDGACVNGLVYDHARRKYPFITDAVRIIGVSPQTGTEPVVVRKSLSAKQKELLQELFLAMHQEPSLQPTLQGLMINRFIKPDPRLYDNIRVMLHEMKRP